MKLQRRVVERKYIKVTCSQISRRSTMDELLKLSPSSSSSTASSGQPRHDIFLSFRGEDTRNNFLYYLYKQLRDKGIQPYLDSEQLQRGEVISWSLMKAIQESKISAIVFSENYADSSWCLEELSQIMRCWRLKEQMVVPIFYHVNPSDVRKQTGSFGNSLIEHERIGTDTDKVQRWRNALAEAGNLSGWHLAGDKPEIEVIDEIVKDIRNKLSGISQGGFKGLVGINLKLLQIKSLLWIGEEGVRMIGIWGMGGIGKTTLALAIYEKVSCQFESCCLILDVRDRMSEKGGIITLRNELLSTLLNEENLRQVITPRTGSTFIKNRLRRKRVLVVLDDVSDFEQFEKLEISHDHFGSGSRIIVTSRNKQVLVNGAVDEIYEMRELKNHDSIQLFSLHAFKQNHLVDDFRDLSAKFLEYAGGHPIALKVLGAALYKKNKEYWKSALNKLKEHPDPKIFDILRISFDGLHEVEKNVFLDMACFFKWCIDREHVTRILDGCYDGMAYCALSNLIDKCLLTGDDYILSMHDLLQEMGREIVFKESNNPGKRTRLWAPKDVHRVLKCNMGTESIKGISLDMSQIKPLQICSAVFEKMVDLAFIRFYNENKLRLANQDFTYLPDLTSLHWDYFPSKSLSSKFSPINLVELILPHSNIEKLWDDEDQVDAVNLRLIDLRGCKNLRKIPNLKGARNLKALLCAGCDSLVELPCLTHLISLEKLHLTGCPISKFPEVPTNLEELLLSGTQIAVVPLFIGSLRKLHSFDMSRTKIQNIPSCVVILDDLRYISLSHCPNITELNLNMNPFEVCISRLLMPTAKARLCLRELDVNNCKSLKSLSWLPTWLDFLRAKDCTSLERVSFTDHDGYVPKFNSDKDVVIAAYQVMIAGCMAKRSAGQLIKKCDVNDEEHADVFEFKGDKLLCCLPGNEISYKFENQSRDSSITVQLDSDSACSRRFLCFALCLVVDFGNSPGHNSFCIYSEYQLKGTDGGSQNFKRKWYYSGEGEEEERLINGVPMECPNEHVLVLFRDDMVHGDKHYKEASFDFYVFGKYDDYEEEIKVKRCGVHVFYVDADTFTVRDVGSSINFVSLDEEDSSPNIISPNSQVRGSMIEEDNANVENGHPATATTISRLNSKRIFIHEGDHEPDKREKLF